MSKKSLKHIAVGFVTSIALMMSSVIPAVHAQAVSTAPLTDGSSPQFYLTLINFVLIFLAVIAMVMIIYGGFLYLSGKGSREKIVSSKKIIFYAVIGIIVILLIFALANTLLANAYHVVNY